MKLESYWGATEAAFAPATRDLPGECDVAIVGGGFTGLSAALALAKRGASVALLEAGPHVANEGSGRNGGHVNNGLAVDYAQVAARVGVEQARSWYQAYDAAVDTVERIVREEAIDCGFARNGKLKLATRPVHLESLKRSVDRLLRDKVDPDVEILDAARLESEIDCDRFCGGMLYKRSGRMHMTRFANGLAHAAEKRGAKIFVDTCVNSLERIGNSEAHRVHTTRGSLLAKQLLLANGAARHGSYATFGWLRRRIVPIGSFVIVTEPLGEERAKALLPGARNYVTIANVHNYFRLDDNSRLIFGGRARFSVSSPTLDAKSGDILRAKMVEFFPSLSACRIDYCWGGLIDMTQDRLPYAGQRKGLFHSQGNSGHGAQMSVMMGEIMAEVMAGDNRRNPWKDRRWLPIPGHFGPPWFLPAVGLYFKCKDFFIRA